MLTTGELALLFRVTSQTVINWLEEGRMPFERIGRGPRRISEREVLRYIDRSGLSAETLDPVLHARLMKAALFSSRHFPAVAVLDADARIIAWNDGMVELFGFVSSEMVGKPIDFLLTRIEGRSGGLEYQVKSVWSGPSLSLKTKHTDRAGEEVRCGVTVSRVFAGLNGDKTGYVLLFQTRSDQGVGETRASASGTNR